MYDVVTISTIKIEDVINDLELPLDHVKTYIYNYDVYKKYPIRDLTFQEIEFVNAIKQVKLMSEIEIRNILDEYELKVADLKKDQLLLERKISRFINEKEYQLTRKYQHFILEPAILHGNFEAPITRPLDMGNIVTLLSNIALGLTTQGQVLDPKIQISALSKIADIYTTSKVLSLSTGEIISSEDLTDLSPKELTRLINHVKSNNKESTEKPNEETKEPMVVKKETSESLKEFILFV